MGGTGAGDIALSIAEATGTNIIDNTPRGLLLANTGVRDAIITAVQNIYATQYDMLADDARQAANAFLYGAQGSAPEAVASVTDSLWGVASREFASSLSGDITVVGTLAEANPYRVFGQVEVPALLDNPAVTSVGGTAIADLRAAGTGTFSSLFGGFERAAAAGGIFGAADGTFTNLAAETLQSLGFSEGGAQTAARTLGFGTV